MRVSALFAAFALIAAPVVSAPSFAYADGIERPPAPRPHQRPQRRAEAPPPAPVPVAPAGPETVTLQPSFFSDGGGGVGVDIGAGDVGYVGGGTTVIVRSWGGRGRGHRGFGFGPR